MAETRCGRQVIFLQKNAKTVKKRDTVVVQNLLLFFIKSAETEEQTAKGLNS